MRTIVGSSTKKTKEIKTERIVDLGAIKSGVPTNVSQYGAAGSDIKELETAKHFASEAEKSAKEAASSVGKAEDFYELTKDAALEVQDNTDDSFKYLEEIRATSIKIGEQEANIDEAEKQVILHTTAAENASQIASDSANSARASEANSAASASSANNSAVSSKESEQVAGLSKNSAIAAATKGHQILAQTEAVYTKTIDDVSQAVQSYLKDKGGFDPNAGLPIPDSWVDIFGVRKNLSCLWTADKGGTLEGIPFNEGDVLLYNASLGRYGRFSGQLVTGGGGGGATEFFNDIKLATDKRLVGTDSKGSTVELVKLVSDIVEAGDKTKVIHLLAKNPKSALVCVANSSSGFDNYEIYHEGNKPTPTAIGAYYKAEADNKFVDVSGDMLTGDLDTRATIKIKTQEVYHPGNRPAASDVDAVSLTKSESITGRKKFTQNPIIENTDPALSIKEVATDTEVLFKVNAKTLTIGTPTSKLVDVNFNNNSVSLSTPKSKTAQGTTADSLTRKDYVDSGLANKLDKTGGSISGDVIVTGKITIGGTGSIFKDINTTGQVKENNIRVYSPANKPTAIDVGALPISGGNVGGAVHVRGNISTDGTTHSAGNITTNGTISEKGQRVYSPNNKPTAGDVGAIPTGGANLTTGSGTFTTTEFVDWLKSKGAMSGSSWSCKLAWDYANNKLISDTGCGAIHLAGASIFVWGGSTIYTIEVITAPTSSTGSLTNARFVYQNHGPSYSPKWFRDYNTQNKPTAADVGAIGIDNVYNKTQADGRFWQRTETVNRSFSSDSVNAIASNASSFKNDASFRSVTTSSTTTGWDGTAGSAIFQGRISNTNNHGWALYNDHASKVLSFGKQKVDGSGFDWFKMYHSGNKPSAADLGLYTKAEVDAKDNLKLNLTGGTLTGVLSATSLRVDSPTEDNSSSIRYKAATYTNTLVLRTSAGDPMIGSINNAGTWTSYLSPRANGNFEYHYGGSTKNVYHTGFKPSAVDVGALALTGGTITGGTRFSSMYKGLITGSSNVDTNGWPNATNDNVNNYINRSRFTVEAGNNGLHFVADGALNARRFGIQAGHSSSSYGNAYGTLNLNPYGGTVAVNGHSIYHAGLFSYGTTPTSNSVAQRTSTGAVQATAFVSPGDFRTNYNVGGGQLTGGGSETGSIKITLPLWKTSTMLKIHVSVYNYVSDTSFDAVVSGYDYSDGNWLNCSAVVTGASSTTSHPVYFGHDGTKACIWIGSVGAKWAHPKISISKVETGYSGGNQDGWSTGYKISFATTLGTLSRTISDALVKPSSAADIADTEPTPNTIVRRNSAGNGAFKGRLLVANSNDSDVGPGTASVDFVSSAGTVYGTLGDIDNTNQLRLESPSSTVVINGASGTVIRHNGSNKITTNASGASITGTATVTNLLVNNPAGVGARFGSTTHKALVGVSSTANEYLFGGSETGTDAFRSYIRVGTNKLEYTSMGGNATAIYHAGNKPTAADVGAAPASHTHDRLTPYGLTDWNATDIPTGFIQGDTKPNAPVSAAGWTWGLNMQHSAGYGMQLAGRNGTDDFYLRTRNQSGIGNWGKVYTSRSKPTAVDVGALPLTGGNISGDIVSTARNSGVFGTYDALKTDQIWSMGTSYRNAADGSNFGTLYGLAYKHTNNKTGGDMARGHQMVWVENGVPKSAMGYDLWTSGNVVSNGYSSSNSYPMNTSVDLNTLEVTCSYNMYKGSGVVFTNAPSDFDYGTLQVIGRGKMSQSFCTQILTWRVNGRQMVRTRNDGSFGWTAWTKVYSENQKPTTTDIGAEPVMRTYAHNVSLAPTNDWVNTGFTVNDKIRGSYMVQIYVNSTTLGFYTYLYSGVMSVAGGASNATTAQEIQLHGNGHASSRNVYLRTLETTGASGGKIHLQIKISGSASSTLVPLEFKFKQII